MPFSKLNVSEVPMSRSSSSAPRTVQQQIRKILGIMSAAMAVIITALTLVLFAINRQYTGVLACANTAADFNKEFKSTLDLEMYNHVIRPRTEHSVEELPMDDWTMQNRC